MKNSNKKGFTLVELVVVIAIIGVLAAILVPSMMGYVKKSRLKTANGNAKTAYNAIAEIDADAETLGHPITWSGLTIADINCTATPTAATLDATASNVVAVVSYEVTRALQTNGNEAGIVHVGGDTINGVNTFFCQWRKSGQDDIFGQYPQAIKNIDQCGTNGANWGTWQNV